MADPRSRPLTGRMAAEALAYLQEGRVPVEPRPAATVILLRPGPEVYLLRRTTTMAFAAGMSVFPGGRVDSTDAAIADSWSGPPPSWFGDRLGCTPDMAAAYVAAAVRETFEESGVLLAGPSADTVVADTTGDDWESDRVALEDRSLGFADFLHRRGLVLRADLLGVWARWTTP
jgi:8-oxo-dGTP pyrophosphatase MutT (NUDIX family)